MSDHKEGGNRHAVKSEHHTQPWYLLALIASSIFVVELIVMLGLERWPIQSPFLANLIDSLLLTLIVFPVLYFFAFRPVVRLQQNLSASEASFKTIFIDSLDGILAVDQDGCIQYANTAAAKLLHRSEKMLAGLDFGYPVKGNSVVQMEIPKADGNISVVEFHCMNTTWEGQAAFLISLHDVTKNTRQTEALQEQALIDELTHLKNRRGFFALAEQQIKQAKRTGVLLLYFIDLDDMKSINDVHGHAAGDQALLDTSDILTRTFRDSDIIGRIGGDEFAVAAITPAEQDECYLGERLDANIKAHNLQAGRSYQVSLSHGVVCYDHENPESLEQLLIEADERMYKQKNAKKKGAT